MCVTWPVQLLFSICDLRNNLEGSPCTAVVPDGIYYQIFKYLPKSALRLLLQH